MADQLDGKVSREDDDLAAVKPARSFRYEDYNTRRIFLRSYPLQWDWSPAPEEKGGAGKNRLGGMGRAGEEKEEEEEHDDGDESCGRRWWKRRQVVAAAAAEWGEEKLLLLRRIKKRLALYLIGCGNGHRPALPFKSGRSCAAAVLATSR